MQTAYWQLCFPIVLRELGTRHASPPRFDPVESVAPPFGAFGRYYDFILPLPHYNRGMRDWGKTMRALLAPALLLTVMAAAGFAHPMTKISILVKSQSGKPVDRASVVVR